VKRVAIIQPSYVPWRLVIGCPEEAAVRMGHLSAEGLRRCLVGMPEGPYRAYLETVAAEFEEGGA
jgi:hypothetical protein